MKHSPEPWHVDRYAIAEGFADLQAQISDNQLPARTLLRLDSADPEAAVMLLKGALPMGLKFEVTRIANRCEYYQISATRPEPPYGRPECIDGKTLEIRE